MSARVLVAGCGDVGLRVAQRLLARGDEVWALRRRPAEDDRSGIRWLRGDLTDPDSLRGLPVEMDQLVYLPAPGARDPAAYRAVFVEGLRHLMGALDRAVLKRALFVSSSAVYGEHGDAWVDEETPPDPPGFNGAVLLEAEQWLASQPVRSVVLRLAGLYGPGRLQLLERLRSGVVRVPRSTPHWANRIHVDDAAAGIVHLLSLPEPAPLYVGVDDTPLPLDVLYDHLAGLLGVPAPAEGEPPAGVGSKRLSNARLRASGFEPLWPDARLGYAALLSQPELRAGA
ncbi:SDR family NAD(P)-dependent oxidoreductase [Dyella solisilvae]|uniref:SDR family NAD(P)-dependent oxidoreductase n=1 Tax=Dyella solisilvae TaxID=1920168 RepID=A0A370KCB5_9GAMM|nr:SDR family oxidoreductase [Dyella solisilvae]RDJ00240.1 SDR family NAD(P)-dependent oxidoreductase [Dyella solisilvae]